MKRIINVLAIAAAFLSAIPGLFAGVAGDRTYVNDADLPLTVYITGSVFDHFDGDYKFSGQLSTYILPHESVDVLGCMLGAYDPNFVNQMDKWEFQVNAEIYDVPVVLPPLALDLTLAVDGYVGHAIDYDPTALRIPPAVFGTAAVVVGAAAVVALLPEVAVVGGAAAAGSGMEALWVGLEARSAAIAAGYTVMQLSPDAEALLAEFGDPSLMQAETTVFAANIQGTVTVFLGNGIGSTFYDYELPQVVNNIQLGTVNALEIILLQ